jgi:hypothetical protein
MTTEASAVTTPTESAPVTTPEISLSSLSQEERAAWRTSGELPSKQDSAPARKSAVADSAPPSKETKEKTAVNASDSATEQDKQPPHRKPENYGEKRFQDLANENKSLKERLDALERGSKPEKREEKQTPQPATEEIKAPGPLREFLDKYFADVSNKGKTYEAGVEAWQDARDQYRDAQHAKSTADAIQKDRQRSAQENAAKELQTKVEDARQRYGEEETNKIFPAIDSLLHDKQIPMAVKALLNDSDILVDLMYTLQSDEKSYKDFLALSKANPAAAIRQIVTTESLVREQLKAHAGKARTTPPRAEDGKFQKTETDTPAEASTTEDAAPPQSRAPQPPVEVGGRTSTPQDGALSAVKKGDFRKAKEQFTRDYVAAHK